LKPESHKLLSTFAFDFNLRRFTEEACQIIPDVIYHLETYEPELIRSAIPNYFLAYLAGAYIRPLFGST